MSKDEKYINLALRMAEAAQPHFGVRFAALLVHKNDVVSVGFPETKSHPFQARFSKNQEAIYPHAETACLKNALKHINVDDLSKCTMYIARSKLTYHGEHVQGMAKPCKGCARALATFKVKRVVYTCDDMGVGEL